MLRFTTGILAALSVVAVESNAVTDELLIEPAELAQADSDWEAKIEKALGAEFSFSGVDVPLREFANQISEKAGITVLVDRLALDDVGTTKLWQR
jgi:type II secretory pathway component GspD/PulD (secretin)